METTHHRPLSGTLTPSGMSIVPTPNEEPIASTPVAPARPRRHLGLVVAVVVAGALAILVLAGTRMLDERGNESVASVSAVSEVVDFELTLERASDEGKEEAKAKKAAEPEHEAAPEPPETTESSPREATPEPAPKPEATPAPAVVAKTAPAKPAESAAKPVTPTAPGVAKLKPAATKKSLTSW